MPQCTVSLQQLKEIPNFLIFLPLFDEVSNNDLRSLRKEFPDELFNILIGDFIGYAKHLKAGADAAMDEELKLDDLQPLHLIEVEYVE